MRLLSLSPTGSVKSLAAHTIRRSEPVVEQQLGLEGALVGRRLGTVVYASIDASDCSGL